MNKKNERIVHKKKTVKDVQIKLTLTTVPVGSRESVWDGVVLTRGVRLAAWLRVAAWLGEGEMVCDRERAALCDAAWLGVRLPLGEAVTLGESP